VVVNRPDINFNRPTINRPVNNNFTSLNQKFNNRQFNNFAGNSGITNNTINNASITNNTALNNNIGGIRRTRPYRAVRPYYPHLHSHWRPSCWSEAYRPAYYNYNYADNGSWLGGGATVAYANPFYGSSVATSAFGYDYSQPIAVPAPNYQESQDDLIRSEQAIRRFDDARELFRRGEYGRANDLIDSAVELLPSDPTLHQFRALVLFARQRYQEAAAALYSVLAVSPGWDGSTLAGLYDSADHYLRQVGDLEQVVVANPAAIDAQFLLAYHYILKGDLAGAQRLLEGVLAVQPNDTVFQSLLAAIRA
jgi:tetratricopeptide (TPR) repeat protein